MERSSTTTLGHDIMPVQPSATQNPEPSEHNDEDDEEALVLPKWRLVCLCISVCFGLFLSLMDTTIVATALYTIGVDLHSLEQVNWVALAYTLSYLGCAVIFARISDIVGRRNAFIAAFLIFFAFSLGCGFARTLNELIAMRVLQGIGGSGLYSLTFVILPEVSPPELAQATGALAGAVVAVAGVLGPVLGGVITRYTTWRWIFWINAPIGIVPLLLFIIAWPSPKIFNHAPRRSIKELDVIGAILVIAASVLVVFSFQEAGLTTTSWTKAIFIAPLVIGIFCWIALLGWEILIAAKWEDKIATMFPLRLIKRRVYMGHFISTLLAGFPYFVVIYSLPLRMQIVNLKSPLAAGVGLVPMLGCVALASAVAGAVNTKKDFIFPTLLLGASFMLIGTAALSSLPQTISVPKSMYGFEVFVGLGFGLMVSTVSLGANIECELRDRTVAQGIIAQARVLGGSLGIAASTAIIGITQHNELIATGVVSPEQLASLSVSAHSLSSAQLEAVRGAYADSFAESMKVCAAISAACVLATGLTWRRKGIDVRKRMKEQIMEQRRRVRAERTMAAESGINRASIPAGEDKDV